MAAAWNSSWDSNSGSWDSDWRPQRWEWDSSHPDDGTTWHQTQPPRKPVTGGPRLSEDRYRNCTTLGAKHPLPLDDRKDILLHLIKLLKLLRGLVSDPDDSSASLGIPRAAVGAWSPVTVQAAFFFLCRAPAGMALRTMRMPCGTFTIEHAAEVLRESSAALYPTRQQTIEALTFLQANCWETQEAIIVKAVEMGFDYEEVSDPKGSLVSPATRSDSRNGLSTVLGGAALPPVLGGRITTLRRQLKFMNTDEEIAHLEKRQKLHHLRMELRAEESRCEAASAEAGTPHNLGLRLPEAPVPNAALLNRLKQSLPGVFFRPPQTVSAAPSASEGSSVSGGITTDELLKMLLEVEV